MAIIALLGVEAGEQTVNIVIYQWVTQLIVNNPQLVANGREGAGTIPPSQALVVLSLSARR